MKNFSEHRYVQGLIPEAYKIYIPLFEANRGTYDTISDIHSSADSAPDKLNKTSPRYIDPELYKNVLEFDNVAMTFHDHRTFIINFFYKYGVI